MIRSNALNNRKANQDMEQTMTVKKMISYRPVWMGIAILWVLFFHSELDLPYPLSYLLQVGYGGVDIFIFASGVGNYYSYLKDESPLDFFKRKIIRLAPAYVPIVLLWCLYSVIFRELSVWAVIGNLFGVQYLSTSGEAFNWYISGILVCYLITPYLAKFVQNNKLKRNLLLLVIALVVVSLSFISDYKPLIIITRMPTYAIGMIFAKYEDANIRKIAAFLVGGFVIGNIALFLLIRNTTTVFLRVNGLYWYPFIIMAPGICWILSELSALCEKCYLNKSVVIFKFLGSFTFEIFLVNTFAMCIFEKTIKQAQTPNLVKAGILVGSVVVAYLFSSIIKRLKHAF